MFFSVCKIIVVLLSGANKNYGSNYHFSGKCHQGVGVLGVEK